MTKIAQLPHRGVIEIDGPDRTGFLQGLVSNDVTRAVPGHAVWSALLTPQGRYLAEFFILATPDSLLLDAPRVAIPDLIRRMGRFRLRSKVGLADRSADLPVHAGWHGNVAPSDAVFAPDPRLAEAGIRIIAREPIPGAGGADLYLAHRLALGLPDHEDLEPDKTLLMEAGFDELHGIDWDKGCYMGQELTARTRYRGLVKRRLVPVDGDADLAAGAVVTAGERAVGEVRTVLGRRGLAMLRLDALGQSLRAGTIAVTPDIPAWLTVPETAAT